MPELADAPAPGVLQPGRREPSLIIEGTPLEPIVAGDELGVEVVELVEVVDDVPAAGPGATMLALPPIAPGVPGEEFDEPTPDIELVEAGPGAVAGPDEPEAAPPEAAPPEAPPPDDPPELPPLCATASAVPASSAAAVSNERDVRRMFPPGFRKETCAADGMFPDGPLAQCQNSGPPTA